MKQVLEAYYQDMLESGKYSSLNAVQLWDDLHSTLTSLTNKFIPSKLSSTRNISLGSTKNSNGLLDKAFQKHRKSGKPAHRKKHNSAHQDDHTKATILNEQFQSVLVGSLLTASAPFVT